MKFQSMCAVAAAILATTATTNAASPATMSNMLLAAPDAPGRPDLTAAGWYSVQIEWEDNSDNERGFEVQRQQRSGGSWGSTTTVASTDANITITSAMAYNGKYRFRVRAWNNQGDSAWSRWRGINTRNTPVRRDEEGIEDGDE